jgi:hypothetical protein
MTAGETGQRGPASGSVAAVPAVAGGGQAAVRAWAGRPALQGLLALAAYLAVFIICFAFPLVRDPGLPQVAQSGPDANEFTWMLRWFPYAISHALNPLYSRQIFAPGGFSLAWASTSPALAVVLAPVTAAFGPIASLNLALALSGPVSAWAAFLAARRLTGQFWPALAAGAVYGLSPYEIDEAGAGHPNLAVITLLPLMVYLTLLWRDRKLGDRVFAGLLAVAIAAEFYMFSETFAEMTALGAVSLLIGFAVARPAQRHTIVRLARLAAIAWVAALALASPYLIYMLRHPHGFALATNPSLAVNLDGAALDPPVAVLLLLIVLALALLAWSSRLTRLLVVMFVLILALAVGPHVYAGTRQLGTVPWAWLWSLPLARSAEPLRLVIFGYLVLAMIVARWLALPAKGTMLLAVRWLLGLAVVVAIVAYIPHGRAGYAIPATSAPAGMRPAAALPAFISSGRYRDYLRPGETVVVVSDRGNAGMLFQADTDFYFRVAGGFVNAAFNNPSALPAPVEALMHPTPAAERQFRAYLRQAGVGAVLVERAWSAPWMQIFGRMGLHGTSAGGVIVYRTG